MTISCTLMKGRDLQPGDLFSTRGQAYWDAIDLRGSVGESVYVRTRMPAGNFPDADADIYRIEIVKADKTRPEEPRCAPTRQDETLHD